MSALQGLLNKFRDAAQSEREKGTYFEELIRTYLRHEATYRDLYSHVWTYAEWAREYGVPANDAGIDLVAKTKGTEEYHAIQCKLYAEDYRIQKRDIDSFFTASGKAPFTRRVIVATTNNWSANAEDALQGQTPPVTKIDLHDLENSQIDWARYGEDAKPVLREQKELRPHQRTALNEVKARLASADRGKLIMACGTGKTFTSLKIAEDMAGAGKRVLFLVPSLSLLSQSLTEWTQESKTPLHSFAVCSDSDVGKKRKKDDDIVRTFMHELRYPATTSAAALAREMQKRHDSTHMSVVFSTYHSIQVLSDAQKEHGLPEFDMIICDEAHRTTGATYAGEEESNFVRVHDNAFLSAKKRLYMTATPRIYGDNARALAERDAVTLCSMDDPALYGETLHTINFSEAVARGLLVDYKVIILTVDGAHISRRLQKLLAGEDNQLKVDDAAKIIGCWKALSKQDHEGNLMDDAEPMKRAVAFCQVIEAQSGGKTHKVSSKNIAGMFREVVEAYQAQEEDHNTLKCEAEHVDGSMNATEKEAKLKWLKEDTPSDTCRILSNVRCLSEGVDVPALDAVLFLTPRNSQVDVVQSVGRIMRKADGKKRGYVVLPVVIPEEMSPEQALNDNKTYKVVWEVLQALRSHDDRFDANMNKIEFDGTNRDIMEVIPITDKISRKVAAESTSKPKGKGDYLIGTPEHYRVRETQTAFQFEVGEIERALYAKVVQKCGNRHHWEDWATDIAKIAQTHITRIRAIVNDPANEREVAAFTAFADELRDDLNGSITNDEVIEMLAQHLITGPVFDAMFKDYSFARNNPVSTAMQQVLDALQEHHLSKEADTLESFYNSVKLRAEVVETAQGKQRIIVELYDKFFRNAFPRMTERLGIVYTPVEVVDFIIHSVNDVLQSEFGQSLGSKGVHIIDPFTGTGTFITRMLQSGLIRPEELAHKYRHEIHANEIILMAYYIAAINIEAVYHALAGGDYQPFEGICLTDTFQLYEGDDMISAMLEDNSARRTRQKELDIRVIMGNPPYSAGQSSANDNNANVAYPRLDETIRKTYAAHSKATNKNAVYDSYIRAIRWGSDRLAEHEDGGVMAFVSNAGWIDGNAMDGLRKCLRDEFSSLYIFHLRGNQRTSGELSRKEGGKIFGSGSRAPIAITLFVKNPNASEHGKIYFHDIGDYLSQQEKLEIIEGFGSIAGITKANGWQELTTDAHNDWLNQRDDSFDQFIEIGNKKDRLKPVLFYKYSSGVQTNRDPWCQNSSLPRLNQNVTSMIDYYNLMADAFRTEVIDFTDVQLADKAKISWTRSLKTQFSKSTPLKYNAEASRSAQYRPFTKQWLYFDAMLNEYRNLFPTCFPQSSSCNRIICISGASSKNFSALLTDSISDVQLMFNGQCFPLKLYEKAESAPSDDLFAATGDADAPDGYTVKDGITDAGLAHFCKAYPGEAITKEDIFYYVYGLLHSEDYRTRYADNLSKQLPRIPCVKKAADFWAFVQAGRKLGELHVGYESVAPYPVTLDGKAESDADYRVSKMKFAKKGDKSVVVYNSHITLRDIPPEAYDYVVNGKPALEWVMERQSVKTDKASGIVNDANLYALETMGDAAYPLKLFQRVITVSLETMKIVRALPKLDID